MWVTPIDAYILALKSKVWTLTVHSAATGGQHLEHFSARLVVLYLHFDNFSVSLGHSLNNNTSAKPWARQQSFSHHKKIIAKVREAGYRLGGELVGFLRSFHIIPNLWQPTLSGIYQLGACNYLCTNLSIFSGEVCLWKTLIKLSHFEFS